MLTLVLAVLAEAIAITMVLTGPPESVTFALRLPLLTGVAGAAVTAAQWRRRVIHLPPEVEEPVPVATPMASPWLVMNSTAGMAFLAAKGYQNHPTLVAGVLIFAGTTGLLALGVSLVQWLRAGRAEFLGEGGETNRAQ
jgi:hypothetical protein